MSAWVETHGRKPKSGARLLQVRFRNGQESSHSYLCDQLRWSDTGDDWDIVAVRRAG